MQFRSAYEARASDEIIVTAERRPERSQDVPISMSEFSEDFIRDNIRDIYDVAVHTPSFQMSTEYGWRQQGRTSMRGLGIGERGDATSANSALTCYDGVPIGTSFGANAPGWDMGRIEVLKGPQGTQFGRNSVAGQSRAPALRKQLGLRNLAPSG